MMFTMNAPALILLLAALAASSKAPSTEMARQSHSFFEKLLDFKVENDLLVIQADPKGATDRNSVYQFARSCFPNVGRLSVRYQSGSSSSSRGGGGSVTIQFQPGQAGGTYQFELNAPSGGESLKLGQKGQG